VAGAVQVLLPKLQHFDLFGTFDSFNKSFLDMVESRWWLDTNNPHYGATRLVSTYASVAQSLPIPEDFLCRMNKLKEEGLDIDLGTDQDIYVHEQP
jgi:hypothetical protein